MTMSFVTNHEGGSTALVRPDLDDWGVLIPVEVEVQMCTFDDVLFSYVPPEKQVAVMKIDCEGCEYDVLYNTDLSMIRRIVGEVHKEPVYPKKPEELNKMDCLHRALDGERMTKKGKGKTVMFSCSNQKDSVVDSHSHSEIRLR